MSENLSPADLCAACGLCCDGTLFHSVDLSATDRIDVLRARGLTIKEKRGEAAFRQPCPAHDGNGCRIYEDRPERCRSYDCQVLERLQRGERTAAEAKECVRSARAQTEGVRALLTALGETNERRPLTRRFTKLNLDPVPTESQPVQRAQRLALAQAMHRLQQYLDAHFRRRPVYQSFADFEIPEAVVAALQTALTPLPLNSAGESRS